MDVISIASDVFVTFGSVKSGKLSRCDYRNTMAPKLLIQACVSVSLSKLKASRYAASSCRPRAAGNPLIWRHADGSGTRAAALARRFVHQGCGIVQARCQSRRPAPNRNPRNQARPKRRPDGSPYANHTAVPGNAPPGPRQGKGEENEREAHFVRALSLED